ncbi:enolase C-terminal domain-like protein [Fodinicurvata sp. EGI_FJ10296]|uniref:enolase C-terminal domain-like protein n=1 Tax=Fodinicurvata sp. EGI_FJ10296 TaxID=3231908 RepID=UPI003454C96B
MDTIDRIELRTFTFEVDGLGLEGDAASTYNMVCRPGDRITVERYAVLLHSTGGLTGEYVTHWVGTRSAFEQTRTLAPLLLGRSTRDREWLFDEFKRELRQYDHMGHGALDIALWDLLGKECGCSVSHLLGRYRQRLPAYASTYHGDHSGRLNSPDAFAEFAEACYQLGYRAFKLHGWHEGEARREAENVLNLRRAMGDRMELMLDPACQLRTFADALYVGRACDEADYLWYEDPFRDSGVSAFAHKRLREKLKTPLLMTEHVRGIEPKADFLIAGGTDILRADPEYDLGITGAMKIGHLAESFGVDVEIHACGPAHRHCMAALRNTRYYEVALVGPGAANAVPPVYSCGYSDQLDAVGADGAFPVPEGPGLGVTYDWDFIKQHQTSETILSA